LTAYIDIIAYILNPAGGATVLTFDGADSTDEMLQAIVRAAAETEN